MQHRLAALLVFTSACSTAISTLQPAETLPKGDVHASAGMNVNIPASRIIDAVDAADDLGGKYVTNPGYEPTAEDRRQALDGAIGLATNAPGVLYDLMLRYGLIEDMEIGLRYTGTALQGDVKFQFLHRNDWSASVSLGYAYYLFDGLLFDVLEYLRIDDFNRFDIHVPIIVGRKLGDFGHVWFGPKYIFGKVYLDAKLKNFDETLSIDTSVHQLGGFCGLALGYKSIFVFAELTVMKMFAKPTVLGQETDIGGIVAMPSVGMFARF